MFNSTRLRLTVLYCVIFFGIFWLFSGGLYFWMSQSFGESYISKITQSEQGQHISNQDTGPDAAAETATIAGDITLGQLQEVILVLNGVLLLVVPLLAWILTGRSLRPVQQMYDQQKQFVSDASHELRTPLTIMKGELDLALKRTRTPKEYRNALTATNSEVRRLQQLVDNLLTIARSEEKGFSSFAEAVDMTDIIHSVAHRLQPLARAKNVSLDTSFPRSQPMVLGVASMLEQLVENVLVNAVKFSPAGSQVNIRCSVYGKDVKVAVQDTGVGMSADTLQHAFDRFYRENSARQGDGFGLGLPICQMIAVQHQGDIAISSKPDKGTTVTITLPRHV